MEMMKKQYITPEFAVLKIQTQGMLAASFVVSGSTKTDGWADAPEFNSDFEDF